MSPSPMYKVMLEEFKACGRPRVNIERKKPSSTPNQIDLTPPTTTTKGIIKENAYPFLIKNTICLSLYRPTQNT